jgi:hypothetical protein
MRRVIMIVSQTTSSLSRESMMKPCWLSGIGRCLRGICSQVRLLSRALGFFFFFVLLFRWMPFCLPVCLFACVLVCLFACLSVCLSVCLLVCSPACLLVCSLACLLVCLFACLSVCLSVCLLVCAPACLLVCSLACLLVRFPVRLFVCLSASLFVRLSACLAICLSSCRPGCLSGCLSSRLSSCLSGHLAICPAVCITACRAAYLGQSVIRNGRFEGGIDVWCTDLAFKRRKKLIEIRWCRGKHRGCWTSEVELGIRAGFTVCFRMIVTVWTTIKMIFSNLTLTVIHSNMFQLRFRDLDRETVGPIGIMSHQHSFSLVLFGFR